MTEHDWRDTWRAWLRGRFGTRLDAPALEAAAQTCEELRALWEPLLRQGPDNGELPFPNALPPAADGPERP